MKLFEGLIDRMNKFEELMSKKRSNSPRGKKVSDDGDDSPTSIKKMGNNEDQDDQQAFDMGEDSEELRKQSEAMDALKKKLEE